MAGKAHDMWRTNCDCGDCSYCNGLSHRSPKDVMNNEQDIIQLRVKELLDQKSREELFRAADVMVGYIRTQPGRLPKEVVDAIQTVRTLQR